MPMVTRNEAANLTPREVALLAEVPKRAVEKAIEEKVLTTRVAKKAGGNFGYLVSSRQAGHAKAREYRHLGAESVVYIALVKKLGVTLNKAGKKALAARLRHLKLDDMHSARVEIAPAVEADVGRLAGPVVERTRKYLKARGEYIVSDPNIRGGAAVIKGTRLTVHSVAGRVDHGDSLDEIAGENPDLPRDALEAAVLYAKAHPPVGRPPKAKTV